jgi:hypothetical protein
MLLLADRGFPSFTLWEKAAATGAGLLWRVSDSFRLPLVEALPKIEQRGGRTATLRSNNPAMIEQELWSMLCVYQAIRQLITDTAHGHHLPPGQISFKNALNAARRTVGADFPPSPPGRQDS